MAMAGESRKRSKPFGGRVDGSSVNNGIRTESTSIMGRMHQDDDDESDVPRVANGRPVEPGTVSDLLLSQNAAIDDLSNAIQLLIERIAPILASLKPRAETCATRDAVSEVASDVCKNIADHTNKIRNATEFIQEIVSRAKI